MNLNVWPKKCPKCGKTHDIRQWNALPFVGFGTDDKQRPVASRRCWCRTELTVVVGERWDE